MKGLFISIMLHCAIFLLIFGTFWHQHYIITKPSYIKAYTVSLSRTGDRPVAPTNMVLPKNLVSKISTHKKATQKKLFNKKIMPKKIYTTHPGRKHSFAPTTLLIYLHNQIQENIAASSVSNMMVNQSMTVYFKLTATGQITAVRLIKTTGLNMLDNAIISAVENIADIPKKLLPAKTTELVIKIYLNSN